MILQAGDNYLNRELEDKIIIHKVMKKTARICWVRYYDTSIEQRSIYDRYNIEKLTDYLTSFNFEKL